MDSDKHPLKGKANLKRTTDGSGLMTALRNGGISHDSPAALARARSLAGAIPAVCFLFMLVGCSPKQPPAALVSANIALAANADLIRQLNETVAREQDTIEDLEEALNDDKSAPSLPLGECNR